MLTFAAPSKFKHFPISDIFSNPIRQEGRWPIGSKQNEVGNSIGDFTNSNSVRVPFNFSVLPVFSSASVGIQPKLKINEPGDKYEREADKIAEQVAQAPEPSIQRKDAGHGKEEGGTQAKPPIVHSVQAMRSGGRPLPESTRMFFEPRFHHSLENVRIHTGPQAERAADSIQARAFTFGNHIAFGKNEYRPRSASGRRLIAHELVHTVQQGRKSASNMIQRNEKQSPDETKSASPSIKDIIPFASGDRIALNQIIESKFILALKFFADSETVEKIEALLPMLTDRKGTFTTLTDDKAVIEIDPKEKTEKKTGKEEKDLDIDVNGAFTIELIRNAENNKLSVFVYTGKGETKQLLGQQDDISVRKTDNGVRLSTEIEGISAEIDVTQDRKAKELKFALTKPLDANLLNIARLPKARKVSAEEEKAVKEAAARASELRKFKRFRIRPEAGVNFQGKDPSFLMGASFQVNFRPIPAASLFFHLPVEVQLQYAPPSSVFAAVNSGALFSLEDTIVPVNIRLITGLGGGSVGSASSQKRSPVFGPTLGAGLDFKVQDTFTVGMRYQHLFNLVGDKVRSNSVTAGFTKRF